MKTPHIILLAIAMILIISCKHRDEAARQKSDSVVAVEQVRDTTAVEDTTSAIINAADENKSDNTSWKQENIASGMAFYKLRYCGGARPTPEIEEQFRKEYPLASQKIKFVNVYDETDYVITATDANGRFTVGLHEGTYDYYIVFTPGSPVPPNPGCQKYFERSYGKIWIEPGNWSGFKLLYAFPCDPCSPPKP
ncbi:hypothetical protein DSECCO2_542900 [anaerobic digester metagenome]